MVRFPVDFPRVSGVASAEVIRAPRRAVHACWGDGLSCGLKLNLGGDVTATDWVYFFLGVSTLSLIFAVFFARPVIGSGNGTLGMQRMATAMKK